MQLPYKIVIIGAPGSGKGTQARRLTKELGIPTLSPGQMYREEVSKGTELGKLVERYTKQGVMVPEEITNDLIAYRLGEPDFANGFIFDGFPRTLMQMGALETMSDITDAIVLKISDKESVRRLSDRWVCDKCGDSFHTHLRPPQVTGICDNCGHMLKHRDDDRPDVIQRRLNTYHRDTEPMIYYYERKGLVRSINGEAPIEEVHAEILTALKRI